VFRWVEAGNTNFAISVLCAIIGIWQKWFG